MKKYEARGDNCRDYIYFSFYSDHRANSKANKSDAVKEYKTRHGRGIEILQTWRAISQD